MHSCIRIGQNIHLSLWILYKNRIIYTGTDTSMGTDGVKRVLLLNKGKLVHYGQDDKSPSFLIRWITTIHHPWPNTRISRQIIFSSSQNLG